MKIVVLFAAADTGDAHAFNEFLALIPQGDKVRFILEAGDCPYMLMYDQELMSARYIASEGPHVECYTVTGISMEQASLISDEFETMADWSRQQFTDAVERSLGVEASRIH